MLKRVSDQRTKKAQKLGDRSAASGTASSSAQASGTRLRRYLGNRATATLIQRAPEAKPAEQKLGAGLKSETTGSYSLSMRQATLKSSLTVSSDGKLKLDLGPVLDFSAFGLSYGPRYDLKGWKGVAQLWIGKEPISFVTDLVVDDEGNVTLDLGPKFVQDPLTLTTKLSFEKGKKSVSETTKIKDLLGIHDMDVKTTMKLGLDEPSFSQELGAEYSVSKGTRKAPAPTLSIGFTASFGLAPGGKETATGIIYLKLVEGTSRAK